MFDSDCARNKNIFPIQFSISETKVVDEIPEKDRDFAFIIPGDLRTYIYNDEAEYYKGYQRSYFAITTKKGGWDCMRHYEILANGCIPYFVDIDKCNPNTMYLLPRHLIREAMNLEGVSYLKIDHSKFNKAKYYEILDKLLEYTRKHLTAKNMAAYLLETVNYSGTGKILFLTTTSNVDYLINSTLIGLKELLGDRVVDIPKVEPIYKSYSGDPKSLYGKGFSYSKIVDDIPVDRNNIKQRIENKEFDLIIYGYLHYELPFHDLVTKTYKPENIVYMCGQDEHRCPFAHLNNLFLREFDSI
jgi:hypothetical protein